MSDFSGLVDRLGANPGIGVASGFIPKNENLHPVTIKATIRIKRLKKARVLKTFVAVEEKSAVYLKGLNEG